jgi:hypothetical protein
MWCIGLTVNANSRQYIAIKTPSFDFVSVCIGRSFGGTAIKRNKTYDLTLTDLLRATKISGNGLQMFVTLVAPAAPQWLWWWWWW